VIMRAEQALPLAASQTLWVWNTLGLLSIPLLVALNGLFVAVEFALVAVRKTRVRGTGATFRPRSTLCLVAPARLSARPFA
jgi:hypothetical protein